MSETINTPKQPDADTGDTALVPKAVTQILSIEETAQLFEKFEQLKKKVLSPDDVLKIKGNPYIKKSGWRKIKTAFSLSLEILGSAREMLDDGTGGQFVSYRVKVRVSHPCGAFADAEMRCDSKEPFTTGKPETAWLAMAETRAFNRAISDLVGGGDVSAEEMTGEANGSIGKQPDPDIDQTVYLCDLCKMQVDHNVVTYSKNHYGKILCYNCQKNVQIISTN